MHLTAETIIRQLCSARSGLCPHPKQRSNIGPRLPHHGRARPHRRRPEPFPGGPPVVHPPRPRGPPYGPPSN
eukprot:12899217-Prorocentrum_lima.AAC.1